jgi:hypothetical protein
MKSLFAMAFCCVALAAGSVYAVQCAAPGSLNLVKANDGTGFIFYPSRSYGDTVFVLPGKEFRKDAEAPQGTVQFFVDEIHYQLLTTPKSQFISGDQSADDPTILARHAQYEYQFVLKAGGRLTEFEELGNRNKPADGGNPAFAFKLWLLKDPKESSGARQYYLATVVGDEVLCLSAIVMGPAYESQVISAFTKVASSLQFVPSEKMCPPKMPSDVGQPNIPMELPRRTAAGR